MIALQILKEIANEEARDGRGVRLMWLVHDCGVARGVFYRAINLLIDADLIVREKRDYYHLNQEFTTNCKYVALKRNYQ